MRNRQLWIVAATGVAVLLLAGVLAFSRTGFAPSAAQAQTVAETTSTLPRTITVVGEGTVKIKPDIAQANIGVEVIRPTVKAASSRAKESMDAVLQALKQQGVDEKDIQTSGFSVWTERPYGPEGPSSDEVLYHVSNQVAVTIRELDTVGTVLDAAIEAGANNIYGVTFSLADPSQAESEAQRKAVDDAQAKAQWLASLNNVKLGDVVSVSEVIGGGGGYYAGGVREASLAAGMGGGDGPIAPGELELTLQLQSVYTVQ
ncbi:MAG: DUF541 domain-containing protein [Anaerolineales bacterium]|nr:MAG: DUF541 domain-containing protein [Anaerolineales bacterium]